MPASMPALSTLSPVQAAKFSVLGKNRQELFFYLFFTVLKNEAFIYQALFLIFMVGMIGNSADRWASAILISIAIH